MKPNSLSPWTGKLALITGASSGIGAATARELAWHGMRVVLVARRHERLEEVAAEIKQTGGMAEIIPADLTVEADRQRVYEEVTRRYGNADVLVNNAGIGWYGYFTDMTWQTAREILQLNISATVQFTLLFMQRMRECNSGHIINIGSVSGSLPSQGIAIYGATKSFLDNFTTVHSLKTFGLYSIIGQASVDIRRQAEQLQDASLRSRQSGQVPKGLAG